MNKYITKHVGLGVHKSSTAVAFSEEAGPARFIGTVGPEWKKLLKVPEQLDSTQALQVVYEAGPCGY